MTVSIRAKFAMLVGMPLLLVAAATPVLSSIQHEELQDAADDRVEDAERAFWAEMQDDLADLHLAARVIGNSERTHRALSDAAPKEALQDAQLFSELYPRLDITLALRDGRVLGDVGPTDTPTNLREIADLKGLEGNVEVHLFLRHGCARNATHAPPAQAVLEPIGTIGWVLVCEQLNMPYLENLSDKLLLEVAFIDTENQVVSDTKHFPKYIVNDTKAGTTLIDRQEHTWAAQRFQARPDIIATPERIDVIATVDVTKMTASVHKRLHWMFAILGLTGILALVIGGRVAGAMSKNLSKIVAGFKRLTQNEYVHVTPVKTRDEIEMVVQGFNQMVDGLLERDKLRTTFGKYMTESVLSHLLNGKVALGGETIKVTILFSDIRSFTTISESMDAQTLVGLLNEYFTEMVSIIIKHNGVVDKYIGDAIMAVFGAPVPKPEDAANAVRAAIEMRSALARLNERLVARGAEPLRTGIGIHTGEVVAGNIGSEQRMEYTVIGDPVNVASRLESCTKDLSIDILMSESTYQEVKNIAQSRPIETLNVKGRAEPITVYEVIANTAG